MDASQDDIFARLNAAIEDWNAQLADSHHRLTERIASAREHLRGLLDAEEGNGGYTPSADTAVALTAAIEEAAELRGSLTDAEARIEALEAELRASRSILDAESDASAQMVELEAEATASQGMALCEAERADAAESALAEEQDAHRRTTEALEASKARVRHLLEEQKEINALRGELEALRAQVAAKDEALALENVEARLHEAQAVVARLESENTALAEERDQLRMDLDRARQAAEDARKLAASGGAESARVMQWMAKQAQGAAPRLADDPFAMPLEDAGDKQGGIVAFDAKGHKRRMGDILVDAGLISREQLDKVLEIQKMRPQQRFGTLVVRMGFADEVSIAHVLAAQLNMPFVDLNATEIDGGAVTVITGRMAWTHMCVPIQRKMGMVLRVAFANPLDIVGIENVERATGARVEPVVATASAIENILRRYFPNLR